jgi:hypothetical protein
MPVAMANPPHENEWFSEAEMLYWTADPDRPRQGRAA